MGIRTPDLLNAIEALYQLSYDPKRFTRADRGPGGEPMNVGGIPRPGNTFRRKKYFSQFPC